MDLRLNDNKYIWHPYTQSELDSDPLAVIRTEGARIVCESGDEYIDAISSWWVMLHGHSHPHVSQKIKDQVDKMHHVIFAGCTHEPAAELAKRLVALLPGDMSKVFFTDNGSSAVEAAVKMAVQYWQNTGQSQKHKFISLEDAYHGDTVGAMSVSGASLFNQPFSDYLFSTYPLSFKNISEEEVLDNFEQVLREGDVAGFIYEPLVQGAAGMYFYSSELLTNLIKLCKKYDVLCIADEVFTGFWKTDTCFASQSLTYPPDIIVLSKALTAGSLPLAVTVASQQLFDGFKSNSRERMFLHGHTFTANPLGCAAALASLDLIETEEFVRNFKRICALQKKQCARFEQFSNVQNCRSRGMILAFEIEVDGDSSYTQPIRDKLYRYCLSKGVLLRPLGNTVYILPPVVIKDEDLERIYSTVEGFLAEEQLV